MLYTDQTVRKILYIIYYIYPITINHTYIQCVLSLFHSFSTWMHELNRNVYTKVMKLQQNKNNLYDSDGFKINGAYNVLCSNKYTWCHHHWTGFSSQFFFLSLFHYNKKNLLTEKSYFYRRFYLFINLAQFYRFWQISSMYSSAFSDKFTCKESCLLKTFKKSLVYIWTLYLFT